MDIIFLKPARAGPFIAGLKTFWTGFFINVLSLSWLARLRPGLARVLGGVLIVSSTSM